MSEFQLVSTYQPAGDQPKAIRQMVQNLKNGSEHNILLGVTGSGKTFTMAHIIEQLQHPALVIAPNKTLAAQLYHEFRLLFPTNAVEYFVSYYDYYQPEAYIPSSNTYIQKDSAINDMIDKLRHSATRSVLTRKDVIVVASVSCIYGLGSPDEYLAMKVGLEEGSSFSRETLLKQLVEIQYQRNDMDFHRGTFRVRGDRVEIFPSYEEDSAVRVDFFDENIERISLFDPLTGTAQKQIKRMEIFPASHYVTQKEALLRAIDRIQLELKDQIEFFRNLNKPIETQRIEERTNFDVEMMLEMGYCNGIENYSRHLTGRKKNEPPPTLLEYFPSDFITFIDESHMGIGQLQGMYRGDRSRKETLIEYGFRLPSALDNRPLMFEEFKEKTGQIVYVSATPAEYELNQATDPPVELIVRPTGLLDPLIEVRPAKQQVDDLLEELRKTIESGERVLVTTLTKRMAEDLTDYYTDIGLQVRYLHSDISTLERLEIIQALREGEFDVLIGINLLREGLDIPEVSLVVVLDADKEGFLRSERSLIQTCGRGARNAKGRVILYGDKITPSMERAIRETQRRREIQMIYNQTHKITPTTIQKEVLSVFGHLQAASGDQKSLGEQKIHLDEKQLAATVRSLEKQMKAAARELDFEQAAKCRDKIRALKVSVVFEKGV